MHVNRPCCRSADSVSTPNKASRFSLTAGTMGCGPSSLPAGGNDSWAEILETRHDTPQQYQHTSSRAPVKTEPEAPCSCSAGVSLDGREAHANTRADATQSMNCLTSLPPALLQQVLKDMTQHEAFAVIPCVCKDWSAAVLGHYEDRSITLGKGEFHTLRSSQATLCPSF